jgi:RNA polymerase sigma factor (sigma-70 family)
LWFRSQRTTTISQEATTTVRDCLPNPVQNKCSWNLHSRPGIVVCMSQVTRILSEIELGDPRAAEQLLPLVYGELRKLAAARLAQEKPGQTLQATALVHEAYLRLVENREPRGQERAESDGSRLPAPGAWNSRGHFFAAAAEAMRRILIENARRKSRLQHGGEFARVDLQETDLATSLPPDELLALDDTLAALAKHDPLAAQLVSLRYFAGLSVEEAAEALGLSRTTAYRQWTYARAWLFAQLHGRSGAAKP